MYVCIQRCAKHCRQLMKKVNCDSEIEIVARSRYSVYILHRSVPPCLLGVQGVRRKVAVHHNMYHSYI